MPTTADKRSGAQVMIVRIAATAFVLMVSLVLATFSARAAVFDEHDTSRLAGINEAIQSFENDVGSALHNLSSDDAEQIESYAYVELNLEAAHERHLQIHERNIGTQSAE